MSRQELLIYKVIDWFILKNNQSTLLTCFALKPKQGTVNLKEEFFFNAYLKKS